MGKDLKGKEIGTGINQRKDGRYGARYIDRFGKRKQLYANSLKEIKNKLAIAQADNIKQANIVDENITLNQWYDKWMRVYKIPIIRENTKRHYDYVFTKLISPYIGNKKLSKITKLQVKDLINKINDKGYQWESQNKVRVLLIDMFNRALEDNFVIRNPAKGVRLAKNKPEHCVKALTKDEQQAFFDCSMGTFYHNLFVVAITTGMRPGELFALTEDDIDFDKNEIHITKTLVYQKFDGDEKKEFHVDPPKTRTSERTIPINSICKSALIDQIRQKKIIYFKAAKETELQDCLFTTKYNTPLNSVLYSEAIKRIVDEINLTRDSLEQMPRFSGHTFRHTFATRCFEAGISPKTVQTYLGHATLQMTMDLYTSVLEEKKQDDMKLFEQSLTLNSNNYFHDNSKTSKFVV